MKGSTLLSYENLQVSVDALLATFSSTEFSKQLPAVLRQLAQLEKQETVESKKATLEDIRTHLESLPGMFQEVTELESQHLNPGLSTEEESALRAQIHGVTMDIRHIKARIGFCFEELLGLPPHPRYL